MAKILLYLKIEEDKICIKTSIYASSLNSFLSVVAEALVSGVIIQS